MKTNWKLIETAPRNEDVLLYHEDYGVFMGRYSYIADWVIDSESKEAEQYDKDTLYKEDWWGFTKLGVERLEGTEAPTHWQELPAPLKNQNGE